MYGAYAIALLQIQSELQHLRKKAVMFEIVKTEYYRTMQKSSRIKSLVGRLWGFFVRSQ